MRRRPLVGTCLLFKVILVLAAHIAGCGYQEERPGLGSDLIESELEKHPPDHYPDMR